MARFVPTTGDSAYDERRKRVNERGVFTRLANPSGHGTPTGYGNRFNAAQRYELASWKLLWMLTWRLTLVVWILAAFEGGWFVELAMQAYLLIPAVVIASRFLFRWSVTPWPLAKLLRGKSPFLRLVRNGGGTGVFIKRSWYRVRFPWE